MLRLKNIKIGDKYAEADYYPEDSLVSGHVVVDLSKGEIAAWTEVPGFGEAYVSHARQQLKKMARQNDTREECLVMWY